MSTCAAIQQEPWVILQVEPLSEVIKYFNPPEDFINE